MFQVWWVVEPVVTVRTLLTLWCIFRPVFLMKGWGSSGCMKYLLGTNRLGGGVGCYFGVFFLDSFEGCGWMRVLERFFWF